MGGYDVTITALETRLRSTDCGHPRRADEVVARGEIRDDVGHVIDIVPTILELARGNPPAEWQGIAVPAAPGKSLVPSFTTNNAIQRDSIWWLHEGNRALRVGSWEIVAAKGASWELYDMAGDRAEQHNKAAENPDLLKKLETEWDRLTEEFTVLSAASK